jgi:uncharacterized protein YggE
VPRRASDGVQFPHHRDATGGPVGQWDPATKGLIMQIGSTASTSEDARSEVSARERRGSGYRGRGWRPLALAGLIAVGIFAALVVSGCGGSSNDVAVGTGITPAVAVGAANTITVTGNATESSAPDEAVLTLTVESDGTDPGAALNANAVSVQKVLDRLKSEGVAAEAIETTNVSVYPIRTYNPDTGQEKLTGYRAQNSVTVTLADAKQVGKVLSAAVEAGANIVSGPVWKLSDDTAAVAAALKKAVANARTKAEALAEAQGVKVGDVVMMNESSVQVPVYPVYYATDSAKAGGVMDTPISAASLDVTATVTITYVLGR